MNINKSELEAVAVNLNQYPPEGVAEIAFADDPMGQILSSEFAYRPEKLARGESPGENTNHQLLPGQ